MERKRRAETRRSTAETEIEIKLNLDGSGDSRLDMEVPFWQHMLEQWSRHSLFDLQVKASGDVQVDHHHLVEDLGLTLGEVFNQSLGEKKGINRYGHALVPMDDALVLAAVDLSGRPYLEYDFPLFERKIGATDAEVAEEFWRGFVNEGRLNLHIKLIHGHNIHHMIEAMFKATARALREAVYPGGDSRDVPSTKGKL